MNGERIDLHIELIVDGIPVKLFLDMSSPPQLMWLPSALRRCFDR